MTISFPTVARRPLPALDADVMLGTRSDDGNNIYDFLRNLLGRATGAQLKVQKFTVTGAVLDNYPNMLLRVTGAGGINLNLADSFTGDDAGLDNDREGWVFEVDNQSTGSATLVPGGATTIETGLVASGTRATFVYDADSNKFLRLAGGGGGGGSQVLFDSTLQADTGMDETEWSIPISPAAGVRYLDVIAQLEVASGSPVFRGPFINGDITSANYFSNYSSVSNGVGSDAEGAFLIGIAPTTYATIWARVVLGLNAMHMDVITFNDVAASNYRTNRAHVDYIPAVPGAFNEVSFLSDVASTIDVNSYALVLAPGQG